MLGGEGATKNAYIAYVVGDIEAYGKDLNSYPSENEFYNCEVFCHSTNHIQYITYIQTNHHLSITLVLKEV